MVPEEAGPDLAAIAGAIERAFPELTPVRPLSLLGSGFRSLALQTASGIVFKVGLSAEARADYETERRVGSLLARWFGAIVPQPRWYLPPSPSLPHGALGYRKLMGETPAWGDDPGGIFAEELGAFMARLHSIPVEAAREAGVPENDSLTRLLGARPVVASVLGARLSEQRMARINQWWEHLAANTRMLTSRVSVCHHDLWHDNLLESETGGLAGVLDLAHVEISDPAHDFSAPCYFGEAFMRRLVASYRTAGGRFDVEDEYRARVYYEGREFGGLAWAIEHSDEVEVAESIEKILRGPLFQ